MTAWATVGSTAHAYVHRRSMPWRRYVDGDPLCATCRAQALDLLCCLVVRGSGRVAECLLPWLPLLRFMIHPVHATAREAGLVSSMMAAQGQTWAVVSAANTSHAMRTSAAARLNAVTRGGLSHRTTSAKQGADMTRLQGMHALLSP